LNLQSWSGGDHVARSLDLTDERALGWLLDRYGGARPRVLQSVLAHAFSLGAQTAIIEFRYIDSDWRDEHKAFYTGTFRRYASVAHRLHFFSGPLSDDVATLARPAAVEEMGYLGYCVLRPVAAAPVGRTFLTPIDSHATTCVATECVNLFGTSLEVTGIAFTAQDAQLSRCAQTTTWVTAYHHHLRFKAPRTLPGDIAAAAAASTEYGRPLPSPGLTIGQIADVARAVGLPPVVYPLRHLPAGENTERVICRYLNSGLPVTVATGSHAFVLVGYDRRFDADGSSTLHFIRHDDEVGPYQSVDWRLDTYGPWEYAIVPLPEKVYLPGEDAEAIGAHRIRDSLDRSQHPGARELVARLSEDPSPLTFRSTVVLSNEYKARFTPASGYPDAVSAAFRLMQMSRYVWVVELIDRDAWHSRDVEKCVLAEAVIDATDHVRDLHVLGWRIPGEVWAWLPDEDRQELREIPDVGPTRSVTHTP
jgi:hypothetical protein